jgi:hypothetical protein
VNWPRCASGRGAGTTGGWPTRRSGSANENDIAEHIKNSGKILRNTRKCWNNSGVVGNAVGLFSKH